MRRLMRGQGGSRGRVSLLVAVALACWVPAVRAIVDDAHSFAMEAALPYVEKGFKVRSDYWKGEVELGEQKAVRHQLFKGNEYCFWLGTDRDGVVLKLEIYDASGELVKAETVDGNHARSLRVLPAKTGTYVVVFSVEAAEGVEVPDEPVRWALAYGYR